jgi:50S ribosomal subunit-associated GTPase HflX
VLTEIGAGDRPIITVLNKADLCDEAERAQALAAYPDAKPSSTKTGEGLPASSSGSRNAPPAGMST